MKYEIRPIMAILGIILGIAMIVCGILSYNDAILDTSVYSGENSPYSSGFASFGADYYTYSVNNTAETASAVKAVSHTIGDLQNLIRDCFSIFMIFFGLLVILAFSFILVGCIESEKKEDENDKTEDDVAEYTEIPVETEQEPVIIPEEMSEQTEE